MYHLDRPMYLLGYLASQQRVYLIDKVGGLPHSLLCRVLCFPNSLLEFGRAVLWQSVGRCSRLPLFRSGLLRRNARSFGIDMVICRLGNSLSCEASY